MDNKKITITIPSLSVSNIAADLYNTLVSVKQRLIAPFILFYETGTEVSNKTKRSMFQSVRGVNSGIKRNKKKMIKFLFPILLIAILIASGIYATRSFSNNLAQGAGNESSVKVKAPKKVMTLNKSMSFPLKDAKDKEIGAFKFDIKSAEIRDEIIVQGKKATSVEGRTFLIVNMQFSNDLTSGLEINSRDYVRLSVNGNTKELLAPDIHNDPVEVQAISIKPTRVGFAINDTDKNLVLLVGEINGEKQRIELKF